MFTLTKALDAAFVLASSHLPIISSLKLSLTVLNNANESIISFKNLGSVRCFNVFEEGSLLCSPGLHVYD